MVPPEDAGLLHAGRQPDYRVPTSLEDAPEEVEQLIGPGPRGRWSPLPFTALTEGNHKILVGPTDGLPVDSGVTDRVAPPKLFVCH